MYSWACAAVAPLPLRPASGPPSCWNFGSTWAPSQVSAEPVCAACAASAEVWSCSCWKLVIAACAADPVQFCASVCACWVRLAAMVPSSWPRFVYAAPASATAPGSRLCRMFMICAVVIPAPSNGWTLFDLTGYGAAGARLAGLTVVTVIWFPLLPAQGAGDAVHRSAAVRFGTVVGRGRIGQVARRGLVPVPRLDAGVQAAVVGIGRVAAESVGGRPPLQGADARAGPPHLAYRRVQRRELGSHCGRDTAEHVAVDRDLAAAARLRRGPRRGRRHGLRLTRNLRDRGGCPGRLTDGLTGRRGGAVPEHAISRSTARCCAILRSCSWSSPSRSRPPAGSGPAPCSPSPRSTAPGPGSRPAARRRSTGTGGTAAETPATTPRTAARRRSAGSRPLPARGCRTPPSCIRSSAFPLSVQQARDPGHLAGVGLFRGLVGAVRGDQLFLDRLQRIEHLREVGRERLVRVRERGRGLSLPAALQLARVAVHARLQPLDHRDRLLDLAGRRGHRRSVNGGFARCHPGHLTSPRRPVPVLIQPPKSAFGKAPDRRPVRGGRLIFPATAQKRDNPDRGSFRNELERSGNALWRVRQRESTE